MDTATTQQPEENMLTRETAWWFIPEEYCPIMLELEKEFNKKIGKPISKECLSEMTDIMKSKQMKHYYGMADKYDNTVKELDKAIKSKGDANGKLSAAKSKAEIKRQRYARYAKILKDMDKEVIVSHFLQYFEKVGILKNENNQFYSFSRISDNIANYMIPRKTAWWFIPEEYCHIMLELEKEFNKKIGEPISKESLLEMADIMKSEQMKHYYGLADKCDETIAELERAIKANGDPKQKLSVAKERTYNKQTRYTGYAEILEDMDKEVIVSHFLQYFEKVGILKNENNQFYSFSRISDNIANYRVPFVTAQIILDCLTRDLVLNATSRTMLFEAMHYLIKDPLFDSGFNGNNRTDTLNDVYNERFKDGLQILKNNGLVAKGITGHYAFVYQLEYKPSEDASSEELKEINTRRRDAALKELEQIHYRFHQNSSTSKEKEKGRLKQAQKDIEEKLVKITIQSLDDRILYHWYHAILLQWYSGAKSTGFITDVITYIRYNNIRTAITPVTEGELYRWDISYSIRSRLLNLIEQNFVNGNKTFGFSVELPAQISIEEYNNAIHRIIKELSRLIGFDKFTIDDHSKQNDRLLSLQYVKATVEANTGHHDALSHLEYLYDFASKNSYTFAEVDQLLLISKLSNFGERNIEYPIKAKGWIYKLNRISFNDNGNDKIWTLIPIYRNLILLSSEEDGTNSQEKYCKKFHELLNSINPTSHTDKILLIQNKLFILTIEIDRCSAEEVSERIVDIWDSINGLYSEYEDPRLWIEKTEAFLLGADYFSRYLGFGYSLVIVASSVYLDLKELNVVNNYIYYTLLNAIGKYIAPFENFITNFDDKYELKLKMAMGEYLSEKCFFYKHISGELFEKEYLLSGCEYARKSAELTDINNLTALNGIADYLAVRLQMVTPLYKLGRYSEADEIIDDSRDKVYELLELLSESERGSFIQAAIDIFSDIDETFTKHPLKKRELRLDYLLNKAWKLGTFSDAITVGSFPDDAPELIRSFYDKWKQFIGMYNFYPDRVDENLKEEFESSSFPETLERFANELPLDISETIIEPATDEDIYMLYEIFVKSYEQFQGSFIVDEADDNISFQVPDGSRIEYPSMDLFFEFFRHYRDHHSDKL